MINEFMALHGIRSFQIDHNSTCNLKCPQCARIEDGKLNPNMPINTLTTDFYKKVFDKSLCEQIESILFCGNYGDVIASPNILEVCGLLKDRGLKRISIFTNGSLRDKSWWVELAHILKDSGDKVSFSIDGLEDTNHLYRIGSRFSKIMENVEAFIGAGGKARWDYLVFAHNEHQVDEAKKRASEMGFHSIKIKRTNRFIRDKQYKSGKKVNSTEVLNSKSEKLHELHEPQKKEYQTRSMNQFENIIEKYKSWDQYIEESVISCKAQKDQSLFIDFEGSLWPCTWVAAPLYFYGNNNGQKKQLNKVIEAYGKDFNNLYKHSLEEVLSHPWYKEQLTKSWCGSMSDSVPKLMTCGRTCGQEYEFSSNAPENRELIEL